MSRSPIGVYLGRALALVVSALLAAASVWSQPQRLHVITDDNYPPYMFRDDAGVPTGYLVDLWKLWEQKTGVSVTLTASRWAEAQRRVLAGDADVIDMIYRTPGREPAYDFTAPYADMPVNLYSHQSVAGIAGVQALQGFRVGVQEGDACAEVLASKGITAQLVYPNYAALFAGAQRGEHRIFCLDQYPAEFYLHKLGLDGEFRKAFMLYTGQFRRATRKGNVATLNLVDRGMASISAAERAALADKWFGGLAVPAPLFDRRQVLAASGLLAAGIGLVLAWILVLRRQVAARTQELQQSHASLLQRNLALEQSDRQLNASQEQLTLALQAAEAGTWSADLATGVNVWSDAVWSLYGLDRDIAPSHEAWKSSIDERDLAAVQAAAEQAVAAQVGYEITWRVRGSASDQPRWLLSRGQPQFDTQGRLAGYRGIVLDISARKDAEATQELFVHAFHDSPNGKYVSRLADGAILDVNGAFCRLLGFTREAVLGRSSPELGIWPDLDDRHSALDELRQHGRIEGRQVWARTCHGELRALLVTSHLTSFRGETCVFTSLVDTTEQVQARQARMRSEARLRALVDTLPDLVWLKDPDGVYLICNRRFEHLVGATEAEIVGRTDHDFTPGELADGFIARDQAAVDAGGAIHFEEEQVFASDGSRALLQVTKAPVRDDAGVLIGVLGVARDITELRRATQELERHREHLAALVEARTAELSTERRRLGDIIDGTNVGTWEWQVQSGQVAINAHWARMAGYAADELSPITPEVWQRLLHPEDLPHANAQLARHLAGTTLMYECEFRMRHKAGHWVWVLARGKIASVDAAGRPVMVSGTHLDISARKAIELELQRAKDAAEAAALAKGSFLANMSHEIRTPLNGVLGMAQIGFRDSLGRAKAQATFRRILDSGKLLLTIINDILDFSKIEAGKLAIEDVALDPAQLIDETVQGVAMQATGKQLQVSVDTAGLPPVVLGDPVRIAQVLYNLLSNAIKFTEQGGVRVRGHAEGGELVVAVHDTGIGIARDVQARLFQPFEQADGSFTRRFGGTGLGLTISRNLSRLMGGSLDVQSTPGQGSTFTLRLPLRPTVLPLAPGRSSPVLGTKRLAGLYLLVAEDNAVNQMVMDDFLRAEGAEVELVGDGQQALDAVERATRPFDVVLMDVQMPGMDGLEATQALQRSHPRLPVIGQTALAFKDELDKCLAAGMVATVPKPIDLDILVSTVLEHIEPMSHARVPARRLEFDKQPLPAELVDMRALEQRFPGRPERVDRLLRLFVQHHGDDAAALRALHLEQRHYQLSQLVHGLIGSAGSLLAIEVERAALEVQELLRRQSPDVADGVERLALALDATMDALRERLDGRPGTGAEAGSSHSPGDR